MIQIKAVTDKLQKECNSLEEVNSIIHSIEANVTAFTFAKECIESMEIYVVLKNSGGYKLFKTIKGKIIVDKLDTSYSESRELVCISGWNIKRAYRINFCNTDNLIIKEIDQKEMHKVLFSLQEPTLVKYVIGVEEGFVPVKIAVDVEMYKSLAYKELKDVILSAYEHVLKKHTCDTKVEKEPSYYLVSYEVYEG